MSLDDDVASNLPGAATGTALVVTTKDKVHPIKSSRQTVHGETVGKIKSKVMLLKD